MNREFWPSCVREKVVSWPTGNLLCRGSRSRRRSDLDVSRSIILLPEAVQDTIEAYRWYESRAEGLGEEFLGSLDAACRKIADNPELYPVRFDSFRRILINRFPYAIYFEEDETKIVIYYIFHCSQNPNKLMRRLWPSDR